MNRSASAHLSKYPNARSSTLAHLIAFERKTEELKREVRAKSNPLRRLFAALRGRG